MTIKLLLLKSGEDLISDIQEMVVGEEDEPKRVVGYFLKKPCLIKIKNQDGATEEDQQFKKSAFQVSLFPWMPLTKDEVIPVPTDWVVTITEPIQKLKDMYIEDVVNYGKNSQDISTNEQSDSDNSN